MDDVAELDPVAGEKPAPPLTLQGAIEAIVGPATFVDMTYPVAMLAGSRIAEAVQVLRLPRETAERDFLLRFRQAGGHLPIASIDLADSTLAWPPAQIAQQERPRTIVIGFESLATAAAAGDRFREPGTALLVPALSGDVLDRAGAHAAMAPYHPTLLTDRDGRMAYLLLVPRQAANPAGRGGGPVSFGSGPPSTVIEAHSIIHDGGHRSEGDSRYAWLWTGPAAQFRMVIPKIDGVRPRLVEICVPRTEEAFNLDRLQVQLDGRPVAHGLDRWSETSGKVKVTLDLSQGHAVLTLVVPKLAPDANSGRLLGLCLDKVILTP